MEFAILGRTELRVDGRSVDIGAAKQRALLSLLLLNVGRAVSVETITDQLWPGRYRNEVRGNLHPMVSRLRTALKRAQAPCELHRNADIDAYLIELDPRLVDYHRFREQVEVARSSARDGDHRRTVALLRDAIALWRGHPLAELRTDWAAQRREQMEISDLLPAHHSLLASKLELKDYGDVLNRIGPLMDDHRYDETLVRYRMRALDGLGRPNEATAFYTRFRQRMVNDLGMEPGPELQETFSQILRRRTPHDGRPPQWQLPRVTNSLSGRDDLLATLDTLLLGHHPDRPAPVVALHGMPGVGKTTLAASWAWSHLRDFPGGGLFLNLHGYGPDKPVNAEDAIGRLLEGLAVASKDMPPLGPQRANLLNRLLARRRTLLVLDNVKDSAHVRPLLPVVSTCPVLITSRALLTGLGVHDGVSTVAIHPLSNQESVALLRRDIGASRPDDDLTSIDALITATGGLPLALKIVAQHAANRPRVDLVDIARELDSCKALLAASGDEEDRDTLHGAFHMSYNALSPDAASLLRLLGLQPRPSFSLHAACAMFDRDTAETEQQLTALVEVHLLEPEGSHRYRLHDLLHAYAATRANRDLSAAQRRDAVERLADFYYRSAENVLRLLVPNREPIPPPPTVTSAVPCRFDDDTEALHWCAKERGNLMAVTRLAARHQLHEFAWRIPATAGEVFERWGVQEGFLDGVRTGIESARAIGDCEAEIGMLNYLGGTYRARHDYHAALSQFQQALSAAEQANHREGMSVSLHNVGGAHLELGENEAAIRLLKQALHLKRALGSLDGEAHTLHKIAEALRRSGRHDEALEYGTSALRIREELGHLRDLGDTLIELGALHHERGEYDLARNHCTRALSLHEHSQDMVKAVMDLTVLARIHIDTQSFQEAITCASWAEELCAATHDHVALAHVLHLLGTAHRQLGHLEAARNAWTRAVELFDHVGQADAETLRTDLAELNPATGSIPTPREGVNTKLDSAS